MLDRYGWCDDVVSPRRVNNMTVDDALLIAHAFHEALTFTGGSGGVWPYPMPDDVAAVCAAPRVTSLDAACNAYAPRRDDMGILPSPQSATVMAAALNTLYGIR